MWHFPRIGEPQPPGNFRTPATLPAPPAASSEGANSWTGVNSGSGVPQAAQTTSNHRYFRSDSDSSSSVSDFQQNRPRMIPRAAPRAVGGTTTNASGPNRAITTQGRLLSIGDVNGDNANALKVKLADAERTIEELRKELAQANERAERTSNTPEESEEEEEEDEVVDFIADNEESSDERDGEGDYNAVEGESDDLLEEEEVDWPPVVRKKQKKRRKRKKRGLRRKRDDAEETDEDEPVRKKRKLGVLESGMFGDGSVEVMKKYWDQNLHHPYPNGEEAADLAEEAHLTSKQVKNCKFCFFSNFLFFCLYGRVWSAKSAISIRRCLSEICGIAFLGGGE